ncbi:MAG TPA: CBS domain-containing protein [Actinospica sp.]|jgi:CBS domain-containing protein|nr:CBS domain-containing protein [Actinospica sp.]
MKTRLVREVMTKDVVTVRTYTSFRMVASAMLSHDVGALPVVDALGHPVGMVSRTDLLAKRAHLGHGPLGSVWERISARGRRTAEASHGATAVRLMSHRAVTVTPDDTVFRAAYLMRRHDVSHLPVVDRRGVVMGIVSRGDLIDEFVREDKLIRDDVLSEVLVNRLDDPAAVEAAVERGVVTLDGQVRFASDASYCVEATRRIAGVVDVVDLLRWTTDDRKPQVGPLF